MPDTEHVADLILQITIVTISSNELLIVKGPLVSVLSNRGSTSSTTLTLSAGSTKLPKSTAVVDTITCEAYTTDSKGNLKVTISNGLPRVFLQKSMLGSKVCPNGTVQPSTSGASPTSSPDFFAFARLQDCQGLKSQAVLGLPMLLGLLLTLM